MKGSLALSFGCLAMAIVFLRGVLMGEPADTVASEAIFALMIFLCVGALAGTIADRIVRDAVETNYRRRVAWYREGLERFYDDAEPVDKSNEADGSAT